MSKSVDKGVLLGVLSLTAIILGIAVISHVNSHQLREKADRAAHSLKILDAIEAINAETRKLVAGQRSFILSGADTWPDAFNGSAAVIRGKVATLKALAAVDGKQAERAEKAAQQADSGLTNMGEVIRVRKQNGFEAMLELARARGTSSYIDPLLETLGEMDVAERKRLDDLESSSHAAYDRTVFYIWGSTLFGLLGIGVLVVFLRRSIGVRARDSAKVAEHKEILNATLSSIGDGVIATDAAGRITFINSVAGKLTGWSEEQARGLPHDRVLVMVHESTRTPLSTMVSPSPEDGDGSPRQGLLVPKGGGERTIDYTAAPIRWATGGEGGTVFVFRDVTERNRADVETRRLTKRLELALSAADLGTWDWDPATDLITLSERASEIYEVLPEQPFNREGMRNLIHPDYRQKARDAAKAAVVSRTDYECEYPLVLGDARRLRWVYAKGRGIYSPAGKLSRMLGVVQDITERKFAEEALQKFAADLAETGRRKDEFLATLAHELRNPLAPLRNGLQIFRVKKPNAEIAEPILEMMERQLGHLVHLVDDLMDVARVSSGKIALRKDRVSLQAVIASAVETSRQVVENGRHELDIQLPRESLSFEADQIRLSQIFANLLNNAAKYTPNGGRITISAERDGAHAVIRIRDTGVGISQDMLAKVFDIFTQVGTSLERAQGGLGIGLTLVKRLVELHGGTIEAHSEGVGRGSEFVIRLPLAAEAKDANATAGEKPSQVHRKLDILVVDDNRDAADSFAELLTVMGHRVKTAYSGADAISSYLDFLPAVSFLDLGMPGMNGYEVAKYVRQRPDLQGMRLVALTGWGQDSDKQKTLEVGFDHHLVKPPDVPTLLSLIADVCRG